MKKLLIMASLFWPQKNSGGPPISILNLVKSIKNEFEIFIISKNHEINDDKPLVGIDSGWNIFDFGKVYYTPKGQHSFRQIYALIEQIQPDVIYQNSFFSIDDLFPVLVYKRKNKSVKVIVAPRGEFYPERIRIGGVKKKLYGKLFKDSGLLHDVCFQGTGEEECSQIFKFLKIPQNLIYNIQNLSVLTNQEDKTICKQSGMVRLVYIARIHPTKNTLKAIQWLSNVSGTVYYDIYGSIEDAEYWQRCEEAIKNLPANKYVCYKGVIDHDCVADVLSKYHAYYMPTTGENYGHSIVEAMLMGRPVIISDQTPWTDVNGNGGYALSLKDETGFVAAISGLSALGDNDFQKKSVLIKNYINQKLNIDATIKEYVFAFASAEDLKEEDNFK